MGLIISRFRRNKTTIEVLEGIDKEINNLQKHRKENQDKQKRFATSLIIYSIVLYILSAVVFFLLYFPDTWPLRLLYSLPLLAFPCLIWGLKKLLHWYFVKRIAGNDLALRDLREKKKQILEDVMETETYKKAKEILEKFDPARFKKLERDEQTSPVSATPGTSGTALTQRKNVSQQPTPMPRSAAPTPASRLPAPQLIASTATPITATPNPYLNTPLRAPRALQPPSGTNTPQSMSVGRGRGGPGQSVGPRQQMMQAQAMPPQMTRGFGPPGPPMPRSVLPKDRGMMDRMMDYLVGDGPENRFALICRACHSHNGMALKEEFEYMSFRCCYCFVMNPARKQRPLAPRLEFFTPTAKTLTLTKPEESEDDDESSDSGEDGNNDEVKKDVDGIAKNKTAPSSSSTSNKSDNKKMPSSSSSSPVVVQTPASSKTKPIQSQQQQQHPSSRSKLPIAGGGSGAVATSASGSKIPQVSQGGPKNISTVPSSNKPSASLVSNSELVASSGGNLDDKAVGDGKDEKRSLGEGLDDVVNITKNSQSEGGDAPDTKCIDGGDSGEIDDEYEMITTADGEGDMEMVSNSGLGDTMPPVPPLEVAKGEDDGSSARSS